MRSRVLTCVVGMALLVGAMPAGAGPCTAGGNETDNIVLLAQELAFPTWGGGSAGLDQPFATIFQSSLGYLGLGCSGSCPFSSDFGDVTCGDLVADPLSHADFIELGGIPNPNAFTELFADLLPTARWSLGAQGFISSSTGRSREVTRTFADFQGGFRDVLDVSSPATTPQPVSINFYMGRGDLDGPLGCVNDILNIPAPLTVAFRVREDPVGPTPPVMLVDVSTTFQTLALGGNSFQVNVRPNSVLYVDVYQEGAAQATGDHVVPDCGGGYTTLDVRLNPFGTPLDGLQVYITPAPTLNVVSRGGLTYAPVPEPGIGPACAAGLLALVTLRARRGAKHRGSEGLR